MGQTCKNIVVIHDGVLYLEEAVDSGGLVRLCESTKLCIEDLHRVRVCRNNFNYDGSFARCDMFCTH